MSTVLFEVFYVTGVRTLFATIYLKDVIFFTILI